MTAEELEPFRTPLPPGPLRDATIVLCKYFIAPACFTYQPINTYSDHKRTTFENRVENLISQVRRYTIEHHCYARITSEEIHPFLCKEAMTRRLTGTKTDERPLWTVHGSSRPQVTYVSDPLMLARDISAVLRNVPEIKLISFAGGDHLQFQQRYPQNF